MLTTFTSTQGFAFSRSSTTDKREVVAAHFSPYGAMMLSSWLASGLGIIAIPKTASEKKEFEFTELRSGLQYTVAIGGSVWLINGLMAGGFYSPYYTGAALSDTDYTVENINSETLKYHKKTFSFMHGFGVAWNTAVALQLESKDKWYYVGAVAAIPFLVDAINRLLINKHKVSPYSTIGFNLGYNNNGTLMGMMNYRF